MSSAICKRGEGVSMKYQECFIQVSCKFQESFRDFWGGFKEVLRIFQGNFRAVSMKVVLKKFKGYFKEVSKVIQASFKGALRVFQGNSKEAKRCFKYCNAVSWLFQGDFKDVSYVPQGCLIYLYGCFMDVSRMFQAFFEEVATISSRVLQSFY